MPIRETVLNRNARYSDNSFDMDAGETRQVTVSLPEKLHIGAPLRVSALNAAPQLISWR